MVDRYIQIGLARADGPGFSMSANPQGQWVKYEDYAELEQGLKLALVYMDDSIQMLFDMGRHGVATDLRSVNQQAYEFNRLAKLIGFKSKYHSRIKEQNDE